MTKDPIGFKGGINVYAYVENNPIDAIDPSGKLRIYGNWCGWNWTGGRKEEYGPHELGYYTDPIDSLDSACRTHDVCYFVCRKNNPCDENKRSQCFLKCDKTLSDSAHSIGGTAGNTIGNAMDRTWPRDPGPNAKDCPCKK